MAAQRGWQSERDDGGEDRSTNGQQVDENDQNEDTARLAVVERRLDQQDRERREYEARMTQMMGQLMNMLNAGPPAAGPAAAKVTNAATLGAPGRAANHGPDQAEAPESESDVNVPPTGPATLGGHPKQTGQASKFRSSSRSDGAADASNSSMGLVLLSLW